MVLLSYVQRLAEQLGAYWLVPDSGVAVGALFTYEKRATVGMAYTTWHTPPACHGLGGRRLS